MNKANFITLEVYETNDLGFVFLAVFYVDKAKKENRLSYKKAAGFDSAISALRAGYGFIFNGEDVNKWIQGNYADNKNKKTFTYIG